MLEPANTANLAMHLICIGCLYALHNMHKAHILVMTSTVGAVKLKN